MRPMAGAVSLFTSALLVVVLASLGGRADLEPNDSFAQAEVLSPGTFPGSLGCVPGPCSFEDVYKVPLAAGATAYLNVTSTQDSTISVYDSAEAYLASSGPTLQHAFLLAVGSGELNDFFYAKVYSSSESTYTISLVVGGQNDAGTGADAGDTLQTADLVSSGIKYRALSSRYGSYPNWVGTDVDWFAFHLDGPGTVSIDIWNDMPGPSGAMVGSLFTASGNQLAITTVYRNPAGVAHGTVGYNAPDSQTLYLHFEGSGPYEFQISFQSEGGDTGGDTEGGGNAGPFGFLSTPVLGVPLWVLLLGIMLVVVVVVAVQRRTS